MGFGVIDPTLNSNGVSPLLLNMRAAIGNTFGLGKALNQMGTLRSTIGATNAQNNAIQKTAMPLALGHVTMQDLLNHRMAINNQYLPEQLKSNINYKNVLTQEMPLKTRIALGRLQQGSEQLLKTPQGYQRYNAFTHQVTPIIDAQGHAVMPLVTRQVMQNVPGIGWTISSVGVNPAATPAQLGTKQNGTPTLNVGQSVSPVTPQQLAQGAQGSIVRSPASPQSRWSTGGSTLFDTQTGNAVSVPTKNTVSKFQQGDSAEQMAIPALKKAFADAAPDMGGGLSAIKRLWQHGERMSGIDVPSLDRYVSAQDTEIPQAAELLIKGYMLNAASENRKAMQDTIRFHWYDTKHSWARRVADTVAGLAYRSGKYRQFLKGGLPLQGKEEGATVLQAISNNVYNDLLHSLRSQQASHTNNDPLGIR